MNDKKTLRILGIDPGFGRMGFGVLESFGAGVKVCGFGCWETVKTEKFSSRIFYLAKETRRLIKEYQPDLAVLEELFFFKNLKTVIKVAQARGAIVLVMEEERVPLLELTPLQVKQSLTGYGRADKRQMQKIVQMILKLKEIPQPDDAADALAMALAGLSYFKNNYESRDK